MHASKTRPGAQKAPKVASNSFVVTKEQLRIEYHPASDTGAAKTPDDIVAVDLASRKLAVPAP
jgi:hypothetical protein